MGSSSALSASTRMAVTFTRDQILCMPTRMTFSRSPRIALSETPKKSNIMPTNTGTPGEKIQKYRFMIIKQMNGEVFEGHPVYRIYNKKTMTQLGIISWYKPWKEYVFSSQPECVFNNSCLSDVLDFIENKIG
jgi:hypothetical protein